jgi:hypothetical protein
MHDGSDVPPPHIIFKGTGFKTMDYYNQSEVDKYHPGEVVLFQEKAWTDARTHIHGLKHCMGPQNERLGESGEKGLLLKTTCCPI